LAKDVATGAIGGVEKLGLGGRCSGCDDIFTLSELLGFDLNSKEVTLT
jgi:hypothetical protein